MAWLLFVVAAACIALAFQVQSLGLAALLLLGALGLMLAGAFKLASARINARAQSAASMIGPDELALIRKRQAAPAASPAVANDGVDDSIAQNDEAR